MKGILEITRAGWALAAAIGTLPASGTASAQVAVVMAPGAGAVSQEQVANLYLGRSADLHPVNLPEGNATRDAFYMKVAARDAVQVKAAWSRIVFSGRGSPPRELPDSAAVKKAVAADPKAMGYIDRAAIDGTVKVVLMLE